MQTPYFFDGRLHLPKTILDELIVCGLSAHTASEIRKGLDMDDSECLDDLRCALTTLFDITPANSPVHKALLDSDIQFMLANNSENASV
ncbi:MAG: hypothetical protein AAF125_22670 [Chloroflexota bacterium]